MLYNMSENGAKGVPRGVPGGPRGSQGVPGGVLAMQKMCQMRDNRVGDDRVCQGSVRVFQDL